MWKIKSSRVSFIFDPSHEYIVRWQGNWWVVDYQKIPVWQGHPLNRSAYEFLLRHYGLPEDQFPFEKVVKMSPQQLVAARRNLEKANSTLSPREFTEGKDH